MNPTFDSREVADAPTFVLKVFHEEPAALGTPAGSGPAGRADSAEAFLASLADAPRYFRLYLAGSVAPREGHAEATGLSALPASMWAPALAAALGVPLASVAGLVPGAWRVPGSNGSPDLSELGSDDTPAHLAALRRMLDNGDAVLHAVPAPDGFDLHAFAPRPLLDRFVAALPPREPGQRRFAAPFRALRSEAKFYFERWGTLPPPAGLVEV